MRKKREPMFKPKIYLILLVFFWSIHVSGRVSCVFAQDAVSRESRFLNSASELDYPPFAIVRPDGTADGFSVELLKAVSESMGLRIHVAVGPWYQIKQELADGALDVLPLVSYSRERDRYFDFTAPYLRMHGAIFVRKGNTSTAKKRT